MQPSSPIRSAANPHLKRLRAALAGQEPGVLVLEGERLVRDGLSQGLAAELLLVSDRRLALGEELARLARAPLFVEDALLARFTSLASAPGVAALFRVPRGRSLAEIASGPRSLLLVTGGVSDPGNLGALARTAEAAGCAAIAVLKGGASPWGPKALRGSMGSLLRLPVLVAESGDELAAALQRAGWNQARAAARGGADPARFEWRGPLALWLGAETGVLPAAVLDCPAVTIPMHGGSESLNVNAAAAVLLFAARAVLETGQTTESSGATARPRGRK